MEEGANGANIVEGPVLIEAYDDEIEERLPTPPPPHQLEQGLISVVGAERSVEVESDSTSNSSSDTNTAQQAEEYRASENESSQGTVCSSSSSSTVPTAASLSSTVPTAASSSSTVPTAESSPTFPTTASSSSSSKASTSRKRTLPALTRNESETSAGSLGLVKNPFDPRPVFMLKRPKTMVDHSYRDYAQVPLEPSDVGRVESGGSEGAFPLKLHRILSKAEYAGIIGWMPHGRSFRIHSPKKFEAKVAPHYFSHSRYSSFLRDLNKYGFKHLTVGEDRNCYYHETFLRGLPHLCKYMPRPKKNPRRLLADPENEPNFYCISSSFPLPDVPVGSTKGVANEATIQKPSEEENGAKMPSNPTGQSRKRDREEEMTSSEFEQKEKSPRQQKQAGHEEFSLASLGVSTTAAVQRCEQRRSQSQTAMANHEAMMLSAAISGTFPYASFTAQQALHLAGPSLDPLTLQLLRNLARTQMQQFPFLDSRR